MLQSKARYIDARPLTASSAEPLATHGRTIHSGQSLPKWDVRATSAFALIATELQTSLDVSNVPKVEMVPTRDHRRRLEMVIVQHIKECPT